jgi:anthranilate phosphoribosyltransferase
MIQRVFDGTDEGPARDAIALNAAAALVVAGGAEQLGDALPATLLAIESGRAAATLDQLVSVSQES